MGINCDHVLEDQNLLAWDDKANRLTPREHFKKVWKFLGRNLFARSRVRWKRNGYASVNFGVPVSMREYCETNSLDFKHLNKELRIPKVAKLAAELMDALRYVMPIIPVPVIAAVLLRAGDKPITSLEIVSGCDDLIDEMITRGAAMKADEKPRHRTLSNSLDLLRVRNLVIGQDDRYRINPESKSLIEYYANSIEHWWR